MLNDINIMQLLEEISTKYDLRRLSSCPHSCPVKKKNFLYIWTIYRFQTDLFYNTKYICQYLAETENLPSIRSSSLTLKVHFIRLYGYQGCTSLNYLANLLLPWCCCILSTVPLSPRLIFSSIAVALYSVLRSPS